MGRRRKERLLLRSRGRRQVLPGCVALDEHDLFDTVAVDVLEIAADANFDIHSGDGDEIAVEQTAVTPLQASFSKARWIRSGITAGGFSRL